MRPACTRASGGAAFAALAVAIALISVITGGCGGGSALTGDRSDASRDGAPMDAPAPDVLPSDAADPTDAAADPNDASRDGAPVDAPAPDVLPPVAAFCAGKARALCAQLTRCRLDYAPEDECRAAEEARCLADGQLEFDATKAADCLGALQRNRCSLSPAEPAPCAKVFVGRIADGQPCVRARECRGGICDVPAGMCAGTCRSLVKAGGRCETIADCEPESAWCAYLVHTCEAKKPRGALCDPTTGYDVDLMCAAGDYCESASGQAACRFENNPPNCRCAALRGPGVPCMSDQQCQEGLLCDVGRCRAPAAAKGDPCGFNVGCAGNLACLGAPPIGDDTTLGVCGDRLAEGAPCRSDVCQSGLHCQFGPDGMGACRRDAAVGDVCSLNPCPTGAFCTFDKVCRLRPKRGESCAGAAEKACWGANLACVTRKDGSSVCVPTPTVGQECNTVCAGGAYCASNMCVTKKGRDASCAADVECASGVCACQGAQDAGCAVKACTTPCSP